MHRRGWRSRNPPFAPLLRRQALKPTLSNKAAIESKLADSHSMMPGIPCTEGTRHRERGCGYELDNGHKVEFSLHKRVPRIPSVPSNPCIDVEVKLLAAGSQYVPVTGKRDVHGHDFDESRAATHLSNGLNLASERHTR